MTDHSARPEGDGLRELIDFVSSQRQHDIAPELRDAILKKVMALPLPTREAAEGVGTRSCPNCSSFLDGFGYCEDCGYGPAAPPQPAPDATSESYCSPNIGPQPGEIDFKGCNHEAWPVSPPNPGASK